MAKQSQPDQALIRMPSFKAVRSFVAAAKYQSFTRAAEALCVTQAAISRQIRELEAHLGTELFERSGREIRLTAAGASFFDAAQLSFLNIYQASERIRREGAEPRSLTLCCSPAFAALCLSPRLKDFLQARPEIELNVVTTQQFRVLEPGFQPDIFITQALALLPGYRRQALFHEVVYPVCTPRFLQAHPQLGTLEGLCDATLLDLNPYGRSQMTELVDWSTWLAAQGHALAARRRFSSNDYGLLMRMVLDDQGVALGWDHLVRPLVEQGRLVRPVTQEMPVRNAVHYLVIHESSEASPACAALRDWLVDCFG